MNWMNGGVSCLCFESDKLRDACVKGRRLLTASSTGASTSRFTAILPRCILLFLGHLSQS